MSLSGFRRGAALAVRSRLIRNVAGIVFLTVAAILSAFLLATYDLYRQSLLREIEARGLGHIESARELARQEHALFLDHLARVSQGGKWQGAALIGAMGIIGHRGTPPRLARTCGMDSRSAKIRDGLSAYEVCWPPRVTGLEVAVAARFDTREVRRQMSMYLLAVVSFGLVIALSITIVLIALLGRRVLFPLLELRDHMVRVAANPEASGSANLPQRPSRDEVADLIDASDRMFAHVAETLDGYRRLQTHLEGARQRAEEADRMKTFFLASVSHELRTPLNAIIGFSDILRQESFGALGHDRYREYADDIQQAGQHLQTMINNILDITKIEAGKMHPEREALRLEELVEASLRMVEVRVREKGVVIDRAFPAPGPMLYADRTHTKQILINVLSNAAKASPEGGVVRVAAPAAPERDTIAVTVTDNGPGMDERAAAKALEPFQQLENRAWQIREGGTGLGLTLAKRLVEINGGRLAIDSAPGAGTAVHITLPAATATAAGGVPATADT